MRIFLRIFFHKKRDFSPLNAFLFNYSIHTQSFSDLSIFHEVVDTATGNYHIIFCSLKIPQGVSRLCVWIARGHNAHLTTMDYTYGDWKKHPTIHYKTDMITAPFVFSISHIILQTCKLFGKYQENIKKCKGCWDNLRVRVSSCSKKCQTVDYNRGGHKKVCFCMNHAACEKRRYEFESLGV